MAAANITVTEQDLKVKFENVAQRYRQPAEHVEKYYAEHEDARESLTDQIKNEKTIEWIKINSKPKQD